MPGLSDTRFTCGPSRRRGRDRDRGRVAMNSLNDAPGSSRQDIYLFLKTGIEETGT